jgi:hypothetical protein
MYLLIALTALTLVAAGYLVYRNRVLRLDLALAEAADAATSHLLSRAAEFNEALHDELTDARFTAEDTERVLAKYRSHVHVLEQLIAAKDARQAQDGVTIANMTQSIETFSDEIDARNVLIAKFLLGGTVISNDHSHQYLNENND